jgi:plastocyanin
MKTPLSPSAFIAALLSTFATFAPLAPVVAVSGAFSPGDLIKGSGSTVYYFASNGKRYVFPNDKTYFTWYTDFSDVKEISDGHLATIPLGGNVTYRPGYKMVKITTDPRTYVVDQGGVLRHVTSENLAKTLYSLSWQGKIDDVPDAFFTNYRMGTPIDTAADYNPANVMTGTPNISIDKQLDSTKVTISIGTRNNGFVPTSITVKRGTEITWTNRDTMQHTVTSAGFDSGSLNPGQSYSRVFNTTGSFDYKCMIHTSIQGTVHVVN